MPAIIGISGTNGGRRGAVEDTSDVRTFAFDLLTRHVSATAIYDRIERDTFPRGVSLVVNNECNLACRHCYLQAEALSRPRLSTDEWLQLLDSLRTHPVELVTVAGKEPLVGTTGLAILRRMGELRRQGWVTRTGAITNGTLLARHRETVDAVGLSYLDISFDGAQVEHDAVRGLGAFNKAADNIRWATSVMGDRVFASMTLHAGNASKLVEAMQSAHDLGFSTVGCSFYCPLPYTDGTLALATADYDRLFASWQDLERVRLTRRLTLHIDLGETGPEAEAAFLASSWCKPEAWELDANGSIYNEYVLANGLCLQFRVTPWPQTLHEVMRISVDGHVLLAADSLNTRRYAERSLANVRDHGFDVVATHRAALAAPRRRALVTEYAESVLPSLRHAFATGTSARASRRAPQHIEALCGVA